jgi:hypothetical protein
MFGWWKKRLQFQAQIDAEAEALIAAHGDSAYHVARDRALECRLYKVVDPERTPEHWDKIRFAIRKRQPQRLDTASRYLEKP